MLILPEVMALSTQIQPINNGIGSWLVIKMDHGSTLIMGMDDVFNQTSQEFPLLKTNVKVGDELRTKVCYNLFSRKGADRLQVRIIIMKMDTNNHSVFLLYYHLILVVKYRRNVFNDDMSDHARDIFAKIAPDYNITLLEWNHDGDHVHVMFKAQPNSELSKFINAYKSASSRLIKKDFPAVKKRLWEQDFWSQSFCLLTAGGAPIEVIKEYIESQGER